MRQSLAGPGAEALPSRLTSPRPPSGPSPPPPPSWTRRGPGSRRPPTTGCSEEAAISPCRTGRGRTRLSPDFPVGDNRLQRPSALRVPCAVPHKRQVFPWFPPGSHHFPCYVNCQRVTSFSNALVALTFALGVSELAKAVPSKSPPQGTLSQRTSPGPVRAAGHS